MLMVTCEICPRGLRQEVRVTCSDPYLQVRQVADPKRHVVQLVVAGYELLQVLHPGH